MRELARRAALALAAVALAACTEPSSPPAWRWDLPSGFPIPRVPADNPMSHDKVELGRHLFWDTRLSSNGTQACASCHAPARAFTDGLVTSLGSTGERGRHNAMSLVNVAYSSSLTWAGDVARLEDQAHIPMFGTTPVELGLAGTEDALLARLRAEPAYQALFPVAFPDEVEPFTIENLGRALASFERTIVAGSSRFDRFVAGDLAALDAAELRGLALFESEALRCARCHGGFMLSSSFDHAALPAGGQVQFFSTGLYDVDGRGAYPAHDRGLLETTGDPAHMGRFKPPTLRNIALTVPYMHDGSVATLDEVMDIYARGGRLITGGPTAGDGAASPLKSELITGFSLTADQRRDLIAFLGALTDDEVLRDPRFDDPWQR